MDSSRFVQLFFIALFSAAIALIGLNELSRRFMQSTKGDTTSAQKLIKDLSGEISVVKPLEGKPTANPAPRGDQSSNSEAAYGAVQSGAQRLVEKLLP